MADEKAGRRVEAGDREPTAGESAWILGDQLDREAPALADARPGVTRILLVESRAAIEGRRWHRQRLHLVLAAMRRFARRLRDEGFEVDHRTAPTLAAGLAAHREAFRPTRVRATEPMSWAAQARLRALGVELLRSDRFLCHHEDFARWADGRARLRMEDFYRWQRRRLGYLMDGDAPAGGRWNYDHDNREPPPGPATRWPEPPRTPPDALDAEVMAAMPDDAVGAPPDGTWATTREGALARLEHFVTHCLPRFGPHQDAMTGRSWHLAHSLLSPYLNLGLLRPAEVCDAVEAAWRAGKVPIASAEGFIRQVIGWREYVWGVYWLWMPEYRAADALGAVRDLPAAFHDRSRTEMACVRAALDAVHDHGYAHHIQRLMVLGNLCLLAAVEPRQLVEWMHRSFVDGAEWVMLPNVVSMALHADGGRMMTKPYAAGGAYLDRMGDACGDCRYRPNRRQGDDACPFTTLYWDFLARNAAAFEGNHRMRPMLRNLERLSDLDAVRARARSVLEGLERGQI